MLCPHIGIRIRHLAAEPPSPAGLLLFCPAVPLWNDLAHLYSNVWDWWVLRAG